MRSAATEGRTSPQSWWSQTREGCNLTNAAIVLMRYSGLLAICEAPASQP